jgi:hypothetical protein
MADAPATAAPAAAPAAPSSGASSATSAPSKSNSTQGTAPARQSPSSFRNAVRDGRSAANRDFADTVNEATSRGGFAQVEDPEESYSTDNSAPDFDEAPVDEAPVEAPEESDYSWAEPYKAFQEGVHGIPAHELLAAIQNGQLPEQLWDQLQFTLKDGDEEWTDTLSGMRNGAMMRKNYTRKLQEFAKERDAFGAERDDLVGYLKGWKEDPSRLLAGLRKMGMPIDGMARMYAQELARVEQIRSLEETGQIPKGTADALLAKQEQDAELEALRTAQQRQQQQTQAQQEEAQIKTAADGMRTNAVNAFRQAGLEITEGTWNMFREELGAIMAAKGDMANANEVQFAVRTVLERVNKWRQGQQQKPAAQPAQQKAPALGKRPYDGGAPKVAQKGPATRISSKELRNRMRDGGWK